MASHGRGCHHRSVKAPCVTVLVVAIGCGTAPSTPAGEIDSVELSAAAGWPSSVQVRSVPGSFRTSVTTLDVDASGRVWLLRDEWADATRDLGTPILERYGLSGHLERRIAFPEGAMVSSFVLHPSGELSVFVHVPDQATDHNYNLEILRLANDGHAIAMAALEDTPGPGENLYYDQAGVHELPAGVPFRLSRFGHVVGLADGEGLYLVAGWTYGFELYRLLADSTQAWKGQVMPANIGMAFDFTLPLLARDEQGRIHVATVIFEDDVHIYGDHFHRPALVPIGSYDVLVQRFDPGGDFSGARLFGGPGVDHPSAMTARAGSALVVGSARLTKLDLPNRTMEWDVFALRGRIDGETSLDSYRTFDLARDDFAWGMVEAPDGTLYLAGRTDYVQVDTNSEVENGKGLLLQISADLSTTAAITLPGPRDVQLRALRLLPDGRIVLAGMRDGPLTHTDPAMTFNDGVWGVARLGGP